MHFALALRTLRAEATVRWPPKVGQPSLTFAPQRLDSLAGNARLDLADRQRVETARRNQRHRFGAERGCARGTCAMNERLVVALKNRSSKKHGAPAAGGRTALAGRDLIALNALS